jgi:hypothetical protein
MKNKVNKKHMEEVLELLANRLNKIEYAQVTSAMSMLFIGHTFGMSEDGFEFINLAIQSRKSAHEKRILRKKEDVRSLQAKIIKLRKKD